MMVGQSGEDTVLQIINATVVGLIFTLVVLVTGSLTAVIIVHVFYNMIAALTGTQEGAGIMMPGMAVLLIYGAWLLFGAGAGAGAGAWAQLQRRGVGSDKNPSPSRP